MSSFSPSLASSLSNSVLLTSSTSSSTWKKEKKEGKHCNTAFRPSKQNKIRVWSVKNRTTVYIILFCKSPDCRVHSPLVSRIFIRSLNARRKSRENWTLIAHRIYRQTRRRVLNPIPSSLLRVLNPIPFSLLRVLNHIPSSLLRVLNPISSSLLRVLNPIPFSLLRVLNHIPSSLLRVLNPIPSSLLPPKQAQLRFQGFSSSHSLSEGPW